MFVPAFINLKFVKPDGMLTDPMQIFMDQLNQSMQNALSDNGWTIPQVSAADLLLIEAVMPDGTIWYETDNHEIVVKVNGALRKVTTTAYP